MSLFFSHFVYECVGCVCVCVCVRACVTEQQGRASQVLLILQAEALQVGLHSHFLSLPLDRVCFPACLFILEVCMFVCVSACFICIYLLSHSFTKLKGAELVSVKILVVLTEPEISINA